MLLPPAGGLNGPDAAEALGTGLAVEVDVEELLGALVAVGRGDDENGA